MAEEPRGQSTVCVWRRWLSERGPFDECTGDGDKDNEGEQDECSGLSNTDERAANVIYNRGVDGADGWEWE